MTEATKRIKPEVRGLKAYALRPDRASIKINQNENPWDAPERIRNETLRQMAVREWSRYPDFVPAKLQDRLASFADWTARGIIAGNGSNELIQATLMVTISAGKRVLICEPTFALYRQITTILGGEIIAAPMKQDLSFDVDAISAAIGQVSPDVTIICSPNNPTGQTIADEDLARLLREAPGLVVIDEAYHEFAGHSAVPLLREHENLIVLRTFSKAMALAGLRVGYLLAAPLLTNEIRKALLPYNLNSFSQTAAEVAIDNYDRDLRPQVAKIIDERGRLFDGLSQINGLTPIPSQANFMIVRSSIEPNLVFEELLRRDILVRDVSGYPMLKDYFRVTVGRPEENDRLLAALGEIFKRQAA
jgi:histidinol-phosphate aminotransferase